MALFKNAFDATRRLVGACACGRHESQSEHDRAMRAQEVEVASSEDGRYRSVVENALMRALFPQDAARRLFIKTLGASTAAAAIASVFPVGLATEALAQTGGIEKKDLKVGFIPITCATPIIMARRWASMRSTA
jgi:nitrate/nitrite transport system substrate-binding protein